LETDLTHLGQTRGVQRRARSRSRNRELALVGYTNAGKSTLLNRLTGAGVLTENRLFSTLDPRTRQLSLPGGETVLLTDTVGFVRKLPHQLVEAFHSTLQSIALADLVVHIVDGSVRDPDGQMTAVRTVLSDIGAADIPELLVINKADRAPEAARLVAKNEDAVCISALTGEGIDGFLRAVADRVRMSDRVVRLVIPYARGDVLAAVHREGEVVDSEQGEEAATLTVLLDDAGRARFSEFVAAS
jgi:GTP-binding protein HflX